MWLREGTLKAQGSEFDPPDPHTKLETVVCACDVSTPGMTGGHWATTQKPGRQLAWSPQCTASRVTLSQQGRVQEQLPEVVLCPHTRGGTSKSMD